MRSRLAHALYSLTLRALSPVYVLRLLVRSGQEPAYRKRIRERFGLYRRKLPRASQLRPHVWLHAVSMGETRAAKPLVRELRERVPGMRLVLTCSTANGPSCRHVGTDKEFERPDISRRCRQKQDLHRTFRHCHAELLRRGRSVANRFDLHLVGSALGGCHEAVKDDGERFRGYIPDGDLSTRRTYRTL